MAKEETSTELFGYVVMPDNKQGHATQIRTKFAELLDFVNVRIPQGRRSALVKTHLEEACMFAIASLAKDG